MVMFSSSKLKLAMVGAAAIISLSACSSSPHTSHHGNRPAHSTVPGSTTPIVTGPLPLTLNGVYCTPTSVCIATGELSPLYSNTGGHTWMYSTEPAQAKSDYLYAVSCPTIMLCTATGEVSRNVPAALYTDNGGMTWSLSTIPLSLNRIRGISCPAAEYCVAVGQLDHSIGAVLSSHDAGRTWSMAGSPPAISYLYSVSCPTVRQCAAVGYDYDTTHHGYISGASVFSNNGGRTWSDGTMPPGIAVLSGVSCISPTHCIAVGSTDGNGGVVLVSNDGGRTWSKGSLPAGSSYLTAVSCASANSCTTIGYRVPAGKGIDFNVVPTLDFYSKVIGPYWADSAADIYYSTSGGTSWSKATVPQPVNALYGVACTTGRHCVAVGWNVKGNRASAIYSDNGGATWASGLLGKVEL